MDRAHLLGLTLLLAACDPPASPPSAVVTHGDTFTLDQGLACRKLTIDGMPCILCTTYVRGGRAPALTCGWPR